MGKEESSTKQRIIQAALNLFSTKGYKAVTVAQIADAVGIKAPSLYKHFKNKQEIFKAMVAEIDLQYKKQMNAIEVDGRKAENDKEFYAGISEDELLEFGETLFLHFRSNNAVKLRKILTLGQYSNKELATMYINRYFKDPIDYEQQSLKMLSEAGRLVKEDTQIMALHFYAPLFLLHVLCDANPDIQKEALQISKQHIRQFIRIYGNNIVN